MAVVEKEEYTQEDARSEAWDRATDPKIVIVGTEHFVGKEKLLEQINAHAAKADLTPDMLRVEGGRDGLVRNVILHFDGDNIPGGLAGSRAKKFMLAMRRPAGGYEEYHVTSPTGVRSKIFFNKDKNPQTKYVERIAKKFKTVIEQEFSGREVHLSTSTATSTATSTVTVDWIPVARLFAPRPRTPQVRWHEKAEQLGLVEAKREELRSQWATSLGVVADEQFCL